MGSPRSFSFIGPRGGALCPPAKGPSTINPSTRPLDFFFKFIAFLFDPVADVLGRRVLETESLRPAFVHLYNMPIIPMTRFNDSVVMGSMVISLILAIPGFFIFRILIDKYRAVVVARIRETKIWKALTATKFFNWYSTYHKLYK